MRLGAEQRIAASLTGSPVRVVAGAGTGKTAVIAERFRQLVAGGAAPESILVMTFTDRAAREMRQRIEHEIGAEAPSVGTFHSIALGWLREDGGGVGVAPGFRLLTGADRWILARELMWSLGDLALTGDERPDDLVSPALQMLERMKQELVPLARLAGWAAASDDTERADLMRACVRVFRAYERECRKQRLLDFDDLLLLAVRMLERNPSLIARYAARHPHVLVDEYQDLNLAQERLVELVAARGDPFVVGDDDQSIYRFRGASRASLERFLASFPSARTVTLGRNRRSSRSIVATAAAVIAKNPDRIAKQLVAGTPGPRVELWSCDDSAAEARAIAREAATLIASGVGPLDIAVLCRTNAIARPIAVAMADAGVPHVVIGGHGFLDLPEIKDVIAMLRVIHDPNDAIALARPAAAAAEPLLRELSTAATSVDVRDLFFELMERSRYNATKDVIRFGEKIAEFCDVSPDHSVAAFMHRLELVLLSGEDEEPARVEVRDAVQLMTIHQSKGLEFEIVFVPSLVEGRLPQSGRSPRFELPAGVLEPLVRGREDVIAEERRLVYVAMTRARRMLNLSFAAHYEGGRRWRPSRFLADIVTGAPRAIAEKTIAAEPRPASPAASNGHAAGEVQLSFSAIAAYLECPRQYWYRHVQRLPAAQSAEAVHGVILHEVLRQAGELRKRRPVTAASLGAIHRDVWRRTPFPDERRAPAFMRNGAAELEAFRAGGGFERAPEHVEHPFEVELDGWRLRGVIDRIDRTDAGWRIIDYKSGRAIARRRRDLQVALYALGARAVVSGEPVELEVVYLASGESVRIEGAPGLIREAEAEGAEVAEGVRSGAFPSRPERRRCRLCPYRLACTEAL